MTSTMRFIPIMTVAFSPVTFESRHIKMMLWKRFIEFSFGNKKMSYVFCKSKYSTSENLLHKPLMLRYPTIRFLELHSLKSIISWRNTERSCQCLRDMLEFSMSMDGWSFIIKHEFSKNVCILKKLHTPTVFQCKLVKSGDAFSLCGDIIMLAFLEYSYTFEYILIIDRFYQ